MAMVYKKNSYVFHEICKSPKSLATLNKSRELPSEGRGQGFESLRVRHFDALSQPNAAVPALRRTDGLSGIESRHAALFRFGRINTSAEMLSRSCRRRIIAIDSPRLTVQNLGDPGCAEREP